uniref:Uncharacterized protein n=1 Tax=Anopheles atroparvus TaxID=41427 RepID=A0A182IL54_ANOAO
MTLPSGYREPCTNEGEEVSISMPCFKCICKLANNVSYGYANPFAYFLNSPQFHTLAPSASPFTTKPLIDVRPFLWMRGTRGVWCLSPGTYRGPGDYGDGSDDELQHPVPPILSDGDALER